MSHTFTYIIYLEYIYMCVYIYISFNQQKQQAVFVFLEIITCRTKIWHSYDDIVMR